MLLFLWNSNSNKDNFIKNLKVIERRLIKNLISITFPHSIYSLDTKIWERYPIVKRGILLQHIYPKVECCIIKGNDNKFDNLIFQNLFQLQTYIEEKVFLFNPKYINFLDLNPTLVHMNNLSNEDKDIVKKII